jgi:hypothetical protein
MIGELRQKEESNSDLGDGGSWNDCPIRIDAQDTRRGSRDKTKNSNRCERNHES